jgi:hypothetical protein
VWLQFVVTWMCFGFGTSAQASDSGPSVGFSLRADAGTASRHVRNNSQHDLSKEGIQSAEHWGIWLTDAHVMLSGEMVRSVRFLLDVDLLHISRVDARADGDGLIADTAAEPVPGLNEAWVERIENGLSFKAGRMWVRTGALENNRLSADIYQSSYLRELAPVRYLTGFEFGWGGAGHAVFIQALNNPYVTPGHAPDDFTWSFAWYGEMGQAGLSTIATALAVPAYVRPRAEDREGGGGRSSLPHSTDRKRKGWLFAVGAGLEWSLGWMISSWEYNWLQSQAGLHGPKQGPTGPRLACANWGDCPFKAFAASGDAVVVQSGSLRMDFGPWGLRPYAKVVGDHAAADAGGFARSFGVSVGLEYAPFEANYRTHLVFSGRREETSTHSESDEYAAIFGTSVRL